MTAIKRGGMTQNESYHPIYYELLSQSFFVFPFPPARNTAAIIQNILPIIK